MKCTFRITHNASGILPGKEGVGGHGPQPVGGHVQPGQLVQLPEDALGDVVYEVVVQVEGVQAGHVLNGLPGHPVSQGEGERPQTLTLSYSHREPAPRRMSHPARTRNQEKLCFSHLFLITKPALHVVNMR